MLHVFHDVESKLESEGEWGNLERNGWTVTGSYLKRLVKIWRAVCNDALLSVQSLVRGLQRPPVGPFEILVVDFNLRSIFFFFFNLRSIIREMRETVFGVRPPAHSFDHDSHTLGNFLTACSNSYRCWLFFCLISPGSLPFSIYLMDSMLLKWSPCLMTDWPVVDCSPCHTENIWPLSFKMSLNLILAEVNLRNTTYSTMWDCSALEVPISSYTT